MSLNVVDLDNAQAAVNQDGLFPSPADFEVPVVVAPPSPPAEREEPAESAQPSLSPHDLDVLKHRIRSAALQVLGDLGAEWYGVVDESQPGPAHGRERVPKITLSPGARSVLVRIAALDPDGDGQLSQEEKDACHELIQELIQCMVRIRFTCYISD